MVAAAKKAEPVLVTGWYGHDQVPVHVGAYEVRNSAPTHYTNALVGGCVNSVKLRWWDGVNWMTEKGGVKSIMGRHHSHQWRGRRMWVLVDRNGLYLTGLRPVHTFKLDMAFARPFKTERQAQRFAARYSHLGLTAVLP